MSERTVKVPNITCGHCVKTIELELSELEGVQSVSASKDSREVTVKWDDDATSWDAVEELMREINYPPEA